MSELSVFLCCIRWLDRRLIYILLKVVQYLGFIAAVGFVGGEPHGREREETRERERESGERPDYGRSHGRSQDCSV